MVIALCALMAGCSISSIERRLSYADSLEQSAARLREYGLVQNADALDGEAQKIREEVLSGGVPLSLPVLAKLLSGPTVEEPVGFAGPIQREEKKTQSF